MPHLGYFENRIPIKPALGAYAASQTTVLHMKRLNQTESEFRDFVCSLFPKANIFYFSSEVVRFDQLYRTLHKDRPE